MLRDSPSVTMVPVVLPLAARLEQKTPSSRLPQKPRDHPPELGVVPFAVVLSPTRMKEDEKGEDEWCLDERDERLGAARVITTSCEKRAIHRSIWVKRRVGRAVAERSGKGRQGRGRRRKRGEAVSV